MLCPSMGKKPLRCQEALRPKQKIANPSVTPPPELTDPEQEITDCTNTHTIHLEEVKRKEKKERKVRAPSGSPGLES